MNITHHFSDGLYAKETHIPRGTHIPQHAHKFDHLALLASGTVDVEVDGIAREFTAPMCINIEAGKVHMVTAKTDTIWYCLWATNETDPERVDDALIQ